MAQGSYGKVTFFNDFNGLPDQIAGVPDATGEYLGGGVGLIGVNEGVLTSTVDEPGGVLSITTDTGDNDNHAIFSAGYKPADGGMWMEARLKLGSVAAVKTACWVGFTETLSLATPVMPAETATVTTTYNGSGGMVGFGLDTDATTIAWRFMAGDGAAALATESAAGVTGGAIGITVNVDTITADRWYLFRVEVDPNGLARGYFGDIGADRALAYVAKTTAALGTGDTFHAVAIVENRDANAEVMEVDYFGGEGYRDWAAT
jgi:hypothetical protein